MLAQSRKKLLPIDHSDHRSPRGHGHIEPGRRAPLFAQSKQSTMIGHSGAVGHMHLQHKSKQTAVCLTSMITFP